MEDPEEDLESDEQREDEWLIVCALRFDYYRYAESIGQEDPFAVDSLLDRALRGRIRELSIFEKLSVFFVLQRKIYKFGWEMEARDSAVWRAFRSLFLELCRVEIPAEFQLAEYHERWRRERLPQLNVGETLIRRNHARTAYRSWEE